MKGIILAGGSGTRLYPITKSISKQILPTSSGGDSMKRLLVTGGAGFIGSSFIRYILDNRKKEILLVNLDALYICGESGKPAVCGARHPIQLCSGRYS